MKCAKTNGNALLRRSRKTQTITPKEPKTSTARHWERVYRESIYQLTK